MDGGIEVILGELIEMVQATAPMLWAIARRQVLANTVGNAVWAGLCILATIVLGLIARHCVRQEKASRGHSDWDAGVIFAGFFACVAFLVALACVSTVIMYSINPDYYAIKVLLGLVR